MFCSSHQSYRAVHPPVADCRDCRAFYAWIHKERGRPNVAEALGIAQRTVSTYWSEFEADASFALERGVQETQLRYLHRRVRELETGQTRTQVIISQMEEVLSVIKPPKPLVIPKPSGDFSSEELLILLSDAQMGTEVIGEELGQPETWDYNTDIFIYRLRLYLHGIMEVVTRHRKAYGVDNVHLWLGGDIIEGQNVFKAQAFWIDSDVMSQYFRATYEITRFIVELARRFKNVKVFTSPGNHARVYSPKEASDLINFEYLMYRNIQYMLKDHKNVEMDVPITWWQIRNINGTRFCFIHGEDIQRWAGFPWYGQDRAMKNYHLFAQHIGQPFENFVHGH